MNLLITIFLIIWLLAIVDVFKEIRTIGKYKLYNFGIQESNAVKGILALGVVLSHIQ